MVRRIGTGIVLVVVFMLAAGTVQAQIPRDTVVHGANTDIFITLILVSPLKCCSKRCR